MINLSVFWRRGFIVAWDLFAWLAAFCAFLLVRYDLTLTDRQWGNVVTYVLAAMTLQVIGGFALHLYLGRSRVGSYAEATTLGILVGLVTLVLAAAFFLGVESFPRGIAFGLPVLALMVMVAGRWTFRNVFDFRRRVNPEEDQPRALVYGAGDAGHEIARLTDTDPKAPYEIAGYLDDDPGKRYLRVRGYRVLGRGKDLEEVASRMAATTVVLAVSQASPTLIDSLSRRCKAQGMKLVVVPPAREMLGGRVHLTQLREVNVLDLLGRRQISTDLSGIADYLTGKVVLVTGGGGSIGSELARQVHRLGPSKLILLDRDESGLHMAQLAIYGKGLLDSDDMVLCDIRDYEPVRAIFEEHRPDVVLHAAALKHLPMLERYPGEGWKTNVLGTLNVLRAARSVNVATFVNISTDKAADATSVLGQTKRLAERLTAWYAKRYGERYLSVRFGNVLGSRGSVLYTFRAQIERGGPITITHPDVTRFFMTIPEACELVLQAGAIGHPGDVLVLDMGQPVRILDVADQLIEESGRPIQIEFTGLRHGEKLHEVLMSNIERGVASEHPLITQVTVPEISPSSVLAADLGQHHEVREFLDLACREDEPTTVLHDVSSRGRAGATTRRVPS